MKFEDCALSGECTEQQLQMRERLSNGSFAKQERNTMANCDYKGMPGVRQPQSLTITVEGCAQDRQKAFTSIYAALSRIPGVNSVDFELRDGKHIFYTRPWAVND